VSADMDITLLQQLLQSSDFIRIRFIDWLPLNVTVIVRDRRQYDSITAE